MTDEVPPSPDRAHGALMRTGAAHRALLAQRHADERHVVAAILCAQWCTACREFLPLLEALAARHPAHSWIWIDIEDDAGLLGDVDIETFPTLALYTGAVLRHFGPVLPNAAFIERLVAGTRAGESVEAPASIAGLVRALLAT